METSRLLDESQKYEEFPSSIGTTIQQYLDDPCSTEVQAPQQNYVQPYTREVPPGQTHVYKRRWYVLMLFSVMASCQGVIWNTWGPIAASTEEAFGWDDADIALLANWGAIAYLTTAVMFAWIIDVKGIRLSMLITGFFITAGAGIRCITSQPPYVKWTVNIAQLLNGLGGPVAMGLPPALSSVWFPPHERTTSTAITMIINYIGLAGSFVLGPYIVTTSPTNGNSTGTNSSNIPAANSTDVMERISKERSEIMLLLYIEFGFVAFIYLLLVIYFPAKPKLPPSTSASLQRMEFRVGLVKLLKNYKFWLVCLTYGISLGVFNCWQSVLDVNLKPHGISENEAGWIGFYSTLAAAGACLIVGRFADIFSKHMRLFLVILYVGASLSLAWFAVTINGIIPNNKISLYTSIILGTLLLTSTPPLYYEMACEITYPVAEGITNLWLTMMNNLGGFLFLLVQMIPNVGTSWENWVVLGSVVGCIPILCTMKERYNRLEVDDANQNQT